MRSHALLASAILGLATAAPASAQDLCEDPAAFCSAAMPPDCVAALTQDLDAAAPGPACMAALSGYRACIEEASKQCGGAVNLAMHPKIVIAGASKCVATHPMAQSFCRQAPKPRLVATAGEDGVSYKDSVIELWELGESPRLVGDYASARGQMASSALSFVLDMDADREYALCLTYALENGGAWRVVRGYKFRVANVSDMPGLQMTLYEGYEAHKPRFSRLAESDCAKEVAAFWVLREQ